MARAVFLDRDGVVIADVGYTHRRDQVRFLPGVSEAIRLFNRNALIPIVVTNQAGVARGYYTEDSVKDLNEYIRQYYADSGATIAGFYYCPHHPEGAVKEYRIECACRKPGIGMIERAVREFSVDPRTSFLVGDKESDIEAGRRSGCRTVLMVGDGSLSHGVSVLPQADHVSDDLYEAARWIVSQELR